MKPFITANFLLGNQTAHWLYHRTASHLPIIDYHNHIPIRDLLINREYADMTQLWLTDDPYKHRLMRISGVPEAYITGSKPPKDKFVCWAKTLAKAVGNPLFHWSNLELNRMFGIDECLSEHNASTIWEQCNKQLQQDDFRAISLLKKWNVEVLITSDDLLDDVNPHQAVSRSQSGLTVFPSLRSDSILAVHQPSFTDWLTQLSSLVKHPITSLEEYKSALTTRLTYFDELGCRLADHALDAGFQFDLPTEKKADELLKKRISLGTLSTQETLLLQSYLLHFLGNNYAQRNWVMQLHIGAQRLTSTRLQTIAGSNGGYATIGSPCTIDSLCLFLDSLELANGLSKTILYANNPADNESFSALTGSFSEDHVAGKIQFGPPWWFNDHQEGIRRHLTCLSSYGLLSQFIGMTTDSRSILSFSRHDYFRRVLCDLLGEWVEKGVIPDDQPLLEELVRGICFDNSRTFFNLHEHTAKSYVG